MFLFSFIFLIFKFVHPFENCNVNIWFYKITQPRQKYNFI